MSAQHELCVQPYLYVSNQTLSSLEQTSGVAFSNDTISSSSTTSLSLANNVFVDTNTLEGGSFELTSSEIEGTVQLNDTHVVLVGCVGGDIVAQNSILALMQSSVGSLVLDGTKVSLNSSTYERVNPPLPSIRVQNPATGKTYNGSLSISTSITGQDLSSISLYLDEKLLASLGNTSTSINYMLNTASISDGVHTLGIIATQQDDLSASAYISFSTDSHYILAQNAINQLINQLNAANTTIASLSGQLSNAQTTLNEQSKSTSQLESETAALTIGLCGSVALAFVALIVAVRKKRNAL